MQHLYHFIERLSTEEEQIVALSQTLQHNADHSLRFDRSADDDVRIDNGLQTHVADALRTSAMASSTSAVISSSP